MCYFRLPRFLAEASTFSIGQDRIKAELRRVCELAALAFSSRNEFDLLCTRVFKVSKKTDSAEEYLSLKNKYNTIVQFFNENVHLEKTGDCRPYPSSSRKTVETMNAHHKFMCYVAYMHNTTKVAGDGDFLLYAKAHIFWRKRNGHK